MCKVEIYPYLEPDGTPRESRETKWCDHPNSCEKEVFRYPLQNNPFPPSPHSTPRATTPIYRSGDESGGSGSSRRRHRSIRVEVNGQSVYEQGDHRRRHSSREPVVIVEPHHPHRTPPQRYTMPRTAPPSPIPQMAEASPRRPRPVSVEQPGPRLTTRPRPHVTIVPPQTGHRRTPSSSSYHSSASEDDYYYTTRPAEAPRRRSLEEQELQQQRIRARIARANAEIASRVPQNPARAHTSRAAPAQEPYIRPGVAVRVPAAMPFPPDPRISEDLRAQQAAIEDEAQKERLRQRLERRTSGARRNSRVSYPSGGYRLE